MVALACTLAAPVVLWLLVRELQFWRRRRADDRSDALLAKHIGRQMAQNGCTRFEVDE